MALAAAMMIAPQARTSHTPAATKYLYEVAFAPGCFYPRIAVEARSSDEAQERAIDFLEREGLAHSEITRIARKQPITTH